MKKMIIVLIATAFFSNLAQACPGPGKHHPDQQLLKQLDLTDEQQQKLEEVMQKRDTKMRMAMKKIHDQTNQNLSGFLSKEQIKVLDENSPERRHRKQPRKKY
ncbi:MAG: hypothetical protein ACWA5R_07190 [bacterium]